MIKDIIKYPQPLSVEYATDVRAFNEELSSLIDDLIDTMKENNLDGLSAYQIGNYYNVVVIKDKDANYVELINPRLINHSGKVTTKEKTAYYGDREANVVRYEKISIIYQDKNGKDRSLQAEGDEAILIQRKIDYTFGATFIHKMSKEEKERFESLLEGGAESISDDYCPTTFQRDKILTSINVVMMIMVLNLIAHFFVSDELSKSLWDYQLYATGGVVVLNIVYFLYAQYEGRKYTNCMSCQTGNILGNCAISLIKLSLLMVISYLFMS